MVRRLWRWVLRRWRRHVQGKHLVGSYLVINGKARRIEDTPDQTTIVLEDESTFTHTEEL